MAEYIMTLDEAMMENQLLETYKSISPLYDISREAVLETMIVDERNYIAIMESLAKAELKYYVSNRKPLFESVTPLTEGVVRDFFDRIIKWFKTVVGGIVAFWKAMVKKISSYFDKDKKFISTAREILSKKAYATGPNSGLLYIDGTILVKRRYISGEIGVSDHLTPKVYRLTINNTEKELSEIQNDPDWLKKQVANICDSLYPSASQSSYASNIEHHPSAEFIASDMKDLLHTDLAIDPDNINNRLHEVTITKTPKSMLDWMESVTKFKAGLTKMFNDAFREFAAMLALLESLKKHESATFMGAYEKIIQAVKYNLELSKEVLTWYTIAIDDTYQAYKTAIEELVKECQIESTVEEVNDNKTSFREMTLDDILKM